MSFDLADFPGKLENWAGSHEWVNKTAEWYSARTGIHFSPFHALELDATFFIIFAHLLLYLYLWTSRSGIRNNAIATGRFLTKKEFNVHYAIPDRLSFFGPRLLLMITASPLIPLLVLLLWPLFLGILSMIGIHSVPVFVLSLLSITFGFVVMAPLSMRLSQYLTSKGFFKYKETLTKMKVYPLGIMHRKKVGLVGGEYRNFLGIRYRKEQRQTHVLVVGPTGSGKTSSFFIPGLIEDAKSGDSCFVIDVKTDENLVDLVGPAWNKEGKKVILFDVWSQEENLGIVFDKEYTGANLLITAVKAGSTASLSEIKAGDIITAIDRNVVNNFDDWVNAMESFLPGTFFKIFLVRGKTQLEINAKVKEGIHFNPLAKLKPDLDNLRTFSTVKTIVDTIYRVNEEETGKVSADASYHKKLEKRLVEDLMFAALFRPAHQKNLYSVAEVLAGTVDDVNKFILEAIRLDGSVDKAQAKRFHKEVAWFLDEKDSDLKRRKPNMIVGAQEKLAIFRAPNVKHQLVRPELNIDALFKEPCLFIVKAPMNKETEQGYLLASMFARLVIVGVAQSAKERKPRKQNIWLYLDEFPNLKIPNITSTIATIRSSSAGVIAAVQDREDMHTSTKMTNFTNSVQSLLTNFGVTVLFPGCSNETCEKISKAFGDKIVEKKSKIQDVWSPITFRSMKQYDKARLITADDLQYMEKEYVMIAPNNIRPFKIEVNPYYEKREYLKVIGQYKDVVCWIPTLTPGQIEEFDPMNKKVKEATSDEISVAVPIDEPNSDPRNTPVYPTSPDDDQREDPDDLRESMSSTYLPLSDEQNHHNTEDY